MAYLMPQPSNASMQKLIDRGLVIQKDRVYPGWGGDMTVREYEVPLDVHAA